MKQFWLPLQYIMGLEEITLFYSFYLLFNEINMLKKGENGVIKYLSKAMKDKSWKTKVGIKKKDIK